MLKSTEEHRRCKNLKEILVSSKLYSDDNGACESKGCSPRRKSRYQVCNVMFSTTSFISRVTYKEYMINFSFYCDLSGVVYLLVDSVYGVQYVGSTSTAFRANVNYFTSCKSDIQGTQADVFLTFSRESHRGFLENARVIIINKLYVNGRQRKVSGNISWTLSFPGVLISGRLIVIVNYCFCPLVLCSSMTFYVV